ncbi:class I SAM-dependent methyltransferase [Rhodococcus sp. NPDC127528]|uniref:class I SAM-dependent methyltransferase n=1 Tax=unclassified Rhodococcus (in: high G+C Gram-positive bacteria) TaxID=192944 RepID=UPI003628FB5B
MSSQPLVSNVSDTARWVAAHRAMESARPDALFRDPLADRLAGERGRVIAEVAGQGMADDWFLVTRTKLIDDQVAAAVAAGCNLVLNLGAGLDTRPYRMELPTDLVWIEVDLPDLVAEKSALLAEETPRCRLVRTAVDVTDPGAVIAFLDSVLTDAARALVISEGLVMYLDEADVVALSAVLTRPEIIGWCLDFSTAGVAQLMADRNEGLLRRAPWTFLPANGVTFFEELGWNATYLESIVVGAARLNRLSPPVPHEDLAAQQPDPWAPGQQPYSAVVRLTHK